MVSVWPQQDRIIFSWFMSEYSTFCGFPSFFLYIKSQKLRCASLHTAATIYYFGLLLICLLTKKFKCTGTAFCISFHSTWGTTEKNKLLYQRTKSPDDCGGFKSPSATGQTAGERPQQCNVATCCLFTVLSGIFRSISWQHQHPPLAGVY